MNSVVIIGRLTKDPDVRYTTGNEPKAVARMTVAVDRGGDRGTDFPNVVAFGKQAENCGKYLSKGKQVGVSGKIHTGKYEKDGRTVYTTDILADRVEFLSPKNESLNNPDPEIPDGFETVSEDDVPF